MAFALAALAGCGEQPSSGHAHVSAGATVDTSTTWRADSALARFRDGLPSTDTLRYAAPSPDALVRAFASALERGDTLALARMHLSRSEFAWLVYPESRFARPPYRQPPDLAWMLIVERSNTALARLLERRAGAPLRMVGHACSPVADVEGRSRYWGGCRVRRATVDGDTVTERLFSSVVERDGRFKIGSYANQF